MGDRSKRVIHDRQILRALMESEARPKPAMPVCSIEGCAAPAAVHVHMRHGDFFCCEAHRHLAPAI